MVTGSTDLWNHTLSPFSSKAYYDWVLRSLGWTISSVEYRAYYLEESLDYSTGDRTCEYRSVIPAFYLKLLKRRWNSK